MSSFKRKVPSKVAPPPGTRTCPISIATILTSSGIPSLDDILGGGMPLSCSLAVLTPDAQSAYGELVQKYFVAQGIANGHKVCIIHEDALSFAKECMWTLTPNSKTDRMPTLDEDDVVQSGEKIKIAWRYEQMKRFETTVTNLPADHFCDLFDLTCRVPASVIDEACDAKRLIPLDLPVEEDLASSKDGILKQIHHVLATTPSTEVVRLCISAVGSPEWGERCPTDILRFLHALHRLLRQHPHACALVTLAPHLCTDLWVGPGWVQKVGWVTDATISMIGFGANPALTGLFPSYHGLVQIHKLPAPHSILPTSDKYSTLRGLSSSAAAGIGTGENNLAFKCTRRKGLIIETMHLDLEGGVTERRTTPSSTAVGLEIGRVPMHVTDEGNAAALARVAVELESRTLEGRASSQSTESGATEAKPQRLKRTRKKVAFQSDKPDLYDF